MSAAFAIALAPRTQANKACPTNVDADLLSLNFGNWRGALGIKVREVSAIDPSGMFRFVTSRASEYVSVLTASE